MPPPTYIAIAGNIGCGKSTLVEFICRTYKLEPFFEPNATNPYLTDFYSDMKTWAFHSQVYFLTHKFRIHQELDRRRGKALTVVQDRTIYEDAEIFARYLHQRGCISDRDWQLYGELYEAILQALRPPDLLIYLRAPVATIRKRVKLRGRQEEQALPKGYLQQLNTLYENWFASYQRSPTVVIDTDKLDYLSDLVHRLDILKRIENCL